MRKKIVAGNWKMNMTLGEGKGLINGIVEELKNDNEFANRTDVVICPPSFLLNLAVGMIDNLDGVFVGAQNCHFEEKGAFTGEISAPMIKSSGSAYVIIGHSERRQYFAETHEMLASKVKVALKSELIPIFCIGELLDVRNEGKHFDLVEQQIKDSLFSLSEEDFRKVVLAYEPVWAIGTGVTASPNQAQEMHAFIRQIVEKHYGKLVADDLKILYGGSCNAQNALELFSQPDVDGGLIGGASLKVPDFIKIIKSA